MCDTTALTATGKYLGLDVAIKEVMQSDEHPYDVSLPRQALSLVPLYAHKLIHCAGAEVF